MRVRQVSQLQVHPCLLAAQGLRSRGGSPDVNTSVWLWQARQWAALCMMLLIAAFTGATATQWYQNSSQQGCINGEVRWLWRSLLVPCIDTHLASVRVPEVGFEKAHSLTSRRLSDAGSAVHVAVAHAQRATVGGG